MQTYSHPGLYIATPTSIMLLILDYRDKLEICVPDEVSNKQWEVEEQSLLGLKGVLVGYLTLQTYVDGWSNWTQHQNVLELQIMITLIIHTQKLQL